MKKLLSFALALFMGISLFAQDAVHYPLNSLPSDWQMSKYWAPDYTDWDFSLGYAFSGIIAANDYAAYDEEDHGVATFLMTPRFALSSANNSGSVEWTAAAVSYDEQGAATVARVYAMMIDATTGESYATEFTDLSSEDGVVTFVYAWDEFLDENDNPLTLPATEHEFVFVIAHMAQFDARGGYAVSDFILRKRDNAFLQFFYDWNGMETLGYLVTDENGSFTAPQNSFTVPTGKTFAYWATYDENDEEDMTLEVNETTTVDADNYWFAVLNDDGQGGGQGEGGQGGQGEGGQGGGQGEGGQGGGQGEGGQGGGQGEGGEGGEGEGGQGGGTAGISSADINSVSLYPNPAQNMVRVNGVTASRLDLMDLTGRTVRSIEGGNTIDLSGLNNGVYMLRITAGESTAVRKVVKK